MREWERVRGSAADAPIPALGHGALPERKREIRRRAAKRLREGGSAAAELAVRIRPPTTPEFEEELVESRARADARAIVLPRAEDAVDPAVRVRPLAARAP